MDMPTLNQGIAQAGSPVALLWRVNPAPWAPPLIEPEYVGWRAEQHAWHESVALSDLSHHMSDTVVEGPDALRLLREVSANDYESFAIGQAKQFIPVAYDGNLITDGILLRESEERFTLSGIPAAQNWVVFHAQKGGYDVECTTDPDSSFRWGGGGPVLFRYQVQGPHAQELVERVFDGPLPPVKFFHTTEVDLQGRRFRALRHGMAGQAGYEFIGRGEDGEFVKDALMTAGEPLGLVHVGAKAYATAGLESGWIPAPTPAVYSDPRLAEYRDFVGLYSYEGQNPLMGSFYSEQIEDYYNSPWEFGYGRSISFNHDFIGRDALEAARDAAPRTKVTLAIEPEDAARLAASSDGFVLRYGRDRVEIDGALVGQTYHAASLDPAGTILILALVEKQHAIPGTRVEVVWGDAAGPTDAEDGPFTTLHATVEPAPYDHHARTAYRRDVA